MALCGSYSRVSVSRKNTKTCIFVQERGRRFTSNYEEQLAVENMEVENAGTDSTRLTLL